MTELQNGYVVAFHNFIRMKPAIFQEILRRVAQELRSFTPGTAKQSTLFADRPLHSSSWQPVRDT